MIEVIQIGNRWAWTLLCPDGRVLVYSADSYETDGAAADAAKSYRAAFWAIADLIDHRQARCI